MEESVVDYSLNYPRERGWGLLFKGGIVTLLGFLVLPYFVVFGYFLRVLESASEDEELPEMNEWTALLKEGLYGFLAIVPYSLLSAAVLYGPPVLAPRSGAAALLGFLAYILVAYAGPAVVMVYATERDWTAAYSWDNLAGILNSGTYLKHILIYVVMYLLLAVGIAVIALISVITIVGPLVVTLMGSFYLLAVTAAYFGRLHGELRS